MNGITVLSDGAGSFVTGGDATHNNIFFTDEIEATQGPTKLTQTEVITTDVICDDLTSTTTNIGTLTADIINSDRLTIYDASNNTLVDLFTTSTFNNESIFNAVSNFNNTVNVTNKNIVQTQSGEINQSGTGTNDFKDSNINGFLVVGSNITQTGGSSSLKDVTCDNLTLRPNKSIVQSGTTSNVLSDTTVSNLVITTSVQFPSDVTIPGTTTDGNIVMLDDSIIEQELLDEPSGKTNILRNTKILDLEVDGDLDMIKAGSTATLKNTIIQGTAQIQGDITQTTGSTVLKTISCNNITLNEDQIITQSGTGYITQSGSGTNTMKAITLLSNANLVQQGSGIISQGLNGMNIFSNFRTPGFCVIAGRNNSINSNTQPCYNNNGIQFQFNRDNSSLYSFIMTNRSTGGNGGFRFQRYVNATYIDEPLVIDENITMNKNVQLPGFSLTCSSATIGNISQSELNCLDNCTVNIQTELNLLSTEIDNLQTSTSGNTTALTGISYNSGTDTTTVDNNLTISSGKNLLLGSLNVGSVLNGISYNAGTDTTTVDNNLTVSKNLLVGTANVIQLIDTNADDIIALNQRTTGISYTTSGDRTTINNNVTMSGTNVTINGTLLVQGMDIKAEIDALETSITTGSLDTTNLTTTNLTVEANTRLGNNAGHTYIKGPFYFCDITTQDETNYTQFYQQSDVFGETTFKIEQNQPNSNISFFVKNIDDVLVETMNITSTAVGINGFLNVYDNTIINGDMTVNGGTADFNCSVKLNEQVQCFLSVSMYDSLSVDDNVNVGQNLNVSGTSNLKTSTIMTSNGQTSNSSLTVGDSKNGVDKSIIVIPNSNIGAYNPIVQTGDISLVGVGDLQNDGRLSISTWSNTKNGVRVTNDSTVIHGGNNFVRVNPTKTQIVGNFVKKDLTAGYMVDGNNSLGTQFYPILCSTKKYRPQNVDDYYIINPGYKFIIFANEDYSGTSYEIVNNGDVVGVSPTPILPGSPTINTTNTMSSIQVWYSDDGVNYNEVTLTGIS
jgi:hypothetical protein